MTKQQKDELKQHFDALVEFCNSDGDRWTKAYFSDLLRLFQLLFVPDYKLKTEEYYDELRDKWLEVETFCEYQAAFNQIQGHEHLDEWFYHTQQRIHKKE